MTPGKVYEWSKFQKLLVFFDNEQTTFRSKNDRFIYNVKRNKKIFMECEKYIGSTQNGHF